MRFWVTVAFVLSTDERRQRLMRWFTLQTKSWNSFLVEDMVR